MHIICTHTSYPSSTYKQVDANNVISCVLFLICSKPQIGFLPTE